MNTTRCQTLTRLLLSCLLLVLLTALFALGYRWVMRKEAYKNG